MGRIIKAKAIQRKAGYMYYVDGAGNVCEAAMKHRAKKK